MSDFDHAMQEAKRLAQTPEGKQLAAMLQQLGGYDVQQAMDRAAAGDMSQAKQMVSALLQDPQARQLLNKLGGGNGK